MSIQDDLNTQMKAAMRAKDKQLLGLIRMLKSKMGEKTTSKNFSGEVNDALWLEVIASYAKSQKKALIQFEGIDRPEASEYVVQIQWELNTVAQWLPVKADEETVRLWVAEAVAGLGGPGVHMGAVMGAVMKAHKSEVDPGMVRKLVEEALA
jgi:hypothetical protein